MKSKVHAKTGHSTTGFRGNDDLGVYTAIIYFKSLEWFVD